MECAGQNVPTAHRIFIDIRAVYTHNMSCVCAFLLLEALSESNHLNFNRKINCI